ncbi:MAG TPA: helix-turn-helix domain-containing protein [Spirochaetota bacterium]|jgi:transcriptional regulator with XRE-family HTH domain|nr:helix-turn-helix domain-containing protein [Spirochaetota bacterium]HOD15017.1 helix-turn-helix domain-containing protein [Spirochaetota bacterium]HPG49480.1 helix-turn-helix domain-containing protein [Spirochaetota bacterium]HPN10533.1 helix-turn-helix domain-containing protein [Spirochaetota bacterium]
MELTDIGSIIEKRRKLLHVNQFDICRVAEISQRTLTAIENGKGNPSLNTLIRILDILGLKIEIKVKNN